MKTGNFVGRVAALFFLAVSAGCQSGPPDRSDRGATGVGIDASARDAKLDPITLEELRAYCPKITLREGTSFYQKYAKGGEGERDKIIFQASVTDVTRSCKYGDGKLNMNIAAAGKVVPGPAGTGGTVVLPIRVVIMSGSEVQFTQLYKHSMTVSAGTGASQYVFSEPNVQIPAPTEYNLRIFIGFDDGP